MVLVMGLQQSQLKTRNISAIQRSSPDSSADQRCAEGRDGAMAGCSAGNVSGTEGDESGSGDNFPTFFYQLFFPSSAGV